MVTVSLYDEYRNVSGILKNANIEEFSFEAKTLICWALGTTIKQILSGDKIEVSDEVYRVYKASLDKRLTGYPLQYIVGEWEFYGYPFKVGEGVLIPRADTETLIDAVKKHNFTDISILDLCSGSGCIAITLKKEIPASTVTALDLSDCALEYIQKNCDINNVNVNICKGNVLDTNSLTIVPEADVIVCNPPYLTKKDMSQLQKEVSFEPMMALAGGEDGLDFYRQITYLCKNKIKDNGMIFYEIGMGQHKDVSDILINNNFRQIEYYKDLNGIIRVISAIK